MASTVIFPRSISCFSISRLKIFATRTLAISANTSTVIINKTQMTPKPFSVFFAFSVYIKSGSFISTLTRLLI